MNVWTPLTRRVANGRRKIAATLMLGLWLVLNLIAAAPDLHHLIHASSDSIQHDCFITQFNNGQYSADVPVAIAFAPPSHVVESVSRPEFSRHFVSVSLLPHSRGPPTPSESPAAVSG